jgi:hypothetical protein
MGDRPAPSPLPSTPGAGAGSPSPSPSPAPLLHAKPDITEEDKRRVLRKLDRVS